MNEPEDLAKAHKEREKLITAMFKEGKLPRVGPKRDSLADATLRMLRGHPKAPGMTDRAYLESLNIEENEITKPLFRAADYVPRSRVTFDIQDNALRFVSGLGKPKQAPVPYTNIRGDMSQMVIDSREIVQCKHFARPGNMNDSDAEEEQLRQIMEWFGVTQNYEMSENKFFHGTSKDGAESTLTLGVWENHLNRNGDFGQAFYCYLDIEGAYYYVLERAIDQGFAIGAIICFNLPTDYHLKLQVLRIDEDDLWRDVFHGLRFDEHPNDPTELKKLWNRHRILDFDLIKGRFSLKRDIDNSPDLQLAFRGKRAWNTILGDKNRIVVATFDII